MLKAFLAVNWQGHLSITMTPTPQARKRSQVNARRALILYILRPELAWATTPSPSKLKRNFNKFLAPRIRIMVRQSCGPCLKQCTTANNSTNNPRCNGSTRAAISSRLIQKHYCAPRLAGHPNDSIRHVIFLTWYPLKLHLQAVFANKRTHLLEEVRQMRG